MQLHVVRMVDCDGNRIGKTWDEWFYTTKEKAEAELARRIKEHNDREKGRAKNEEFIRRELAALKDPEDWWRLYREDTVEKVKGWCCWAYSNMLFVTTVNVIE